MSQMPWPSTFPARNPLMGVAFVPEDAMDPAFTGDVIVALHGSWATRPSGGIFGDRSTRRPPKVVVVRFAEGEARRVDDLNYPNVQPTRCPRFVFDCQEPEDLALYADAVPKLVGVGTPIPVSWLQERLRIPAPEKDKAALSRAAPAAPPTEGEALRAAVAALQRRRPTIPELDLADVAGQTSYSFSPSSLTGGPKRYARSAAKGAPLWAVRLRRGLCEK